MPPVLDQGSTASGHATKLKIFSKRALARSCAMSIRYRNPADARDSCRRATLLFQAGDR
jgi:hypothetical protein